MHFLSRPTCPTSRPHRPIRFLAAAPCRPRLPYNEPPIFAAIPFDSTGSWDEGDRTDSEADELPSSSLDEFLMASSGGRIDEEERSEAARKLMRQHEQSEIGSKYGEGFVQFRPGGEALHLSVDLINEKLQHRGAARHRHVSRPDEQFGLIFNFDGVLAPVRAAYVRSWAALAAAKCIPVALTQHQQQALGLRSTTPERAMIDVLGWTRDVAVARQVAWELSELYAEELVKIDTPNPGVQQWLSTLSTYRVPCALVSSLDRKTVKEMLARMNLNHHFNVMVTADDDMETMSQRLLAASLQLHRPPKLCVAFEDNPAGITAAHNCTMKAVAVCSHYPAYQLKQADLTCGGLDALAVYNIRRLFAQQGSEFMDMQQKQSGNRYRRHRPVAGGTIP